MKKEIAEKVADLLKLRSGYTDNLEVLQLSHRYNIELEGVSKDTNEKYIQMAKKDIEKKIKDIDREIEEIKC